METTTYSVSLISSCGIGFYPIMLIVVVKDFLYIVFLDGGNIRIHTYHASEYVF